MIEQTGRPNVTNSMDPRHTRFLATFMVAIGLFLMIAIIYIASANPAALNGIVFKMFVAGILSAVVICAFGAILFILAAKSEPN